MSIYYFFSTHYFLFLNSIFSESEGIFMKNFETNICIEGYKPLDFTTESGDRVKMCKLNYSYIGTKETEIGRQFVTLNVPYEYCDKLKGCKFPLNAILVFSVENFTKKPDIIDIKILNDNK